MVCKERPILDPIIEERQPKPNDISDYEELRDVIDLALWTGQLLLQHGAPSQIVEETVHRVGTGLGCDWLDVVVSMGSVTVTSSSHDDFRTKTRRVVKIGVNMAIIEGINQLSHDIWHGKVNRLSTRTTLERISTAPRYYGRWTTIVYVGLACAAFSRLFGGDIPTLIITFCASAVAMFVRQAMLKRYFNNFLVIFVTAFVAGTVASLASYVSPTPENALASSVLLLIPGVPLINSAEDIIEGHFMTGIARGITGAIIALILALGLLLTMQLTGVGL